MVSVAKPNGAELETPDHAVQAVEELVAEFGVKAVVAACMRSSAGDELTRGGNTATLHVAQSIIREIVFAEDPRLEAEVMALGAGIILRDGDTMRRIAAKYGVTVAAISKRVVAFCDENQLPPSIYMRSAKDRKTYSLTNRPRR